MIMLPANVTVRAPTMDDAQAAYELTAAYEVAEWGERDTEPDDIPEQWAKMDLHRDAFVIEAPDGSMAALATVRRDDVTRLVTDYAVHPAFRGQGMRRYLLGLVEARARELAAHLPPTTPLVLDTYVNGFKAGAGELERAEGYTLVRRHYRMLIRMDAPPPAPEWPEGIAVRTVVPGEEERSVYGVVVEAFADGWEHRPPSFEDWRGEQFGGRKFDPALWWIAQDGEQIAAVALGIHFWDLGWLRSIAVRRPWRRRGIALALVRHAFGEFYRRGERTVALGVDATNPTGALRLYERAGMHVAMQFDQYRKELEGGSG